MITFLIILFSTLLYAVVHTYVVYPLLLSVLYQLKKKNHPSSSFVEASIKPVSILMAAYNEEKVIEEKIHSIFKSTYPANMIEVWVGSDCSTDKTNAILTNLEKQYPQLHTVLFDERQGKIKIINQLIHKASHDIIIITDANVIFEKDTILELTKKFEEDALIGLVDTHMRHKGLNDSGISKQENFYISTEVKIKHYESQLWGMMMGPFGGCYAIRKSLFKPVPENFLVDDFFINIHVLVLGYKAINNLNAVVYEDVSNNLIHEFKRKIRIATGNFQNLDYYKFIFKRPSILAFCFLSHKVLRWFSPLFLIIAFVCSIILAIKGLDLFMFLTFLAVFLAVLVLFERILSYFSINLRYLRLITHFSYMNIALLIGLYKFIKGVKSSIWNPTPRLQSENH